MATAKVFENTKMMRARRRGREVRGKGQSQWARGLSVPKGPTQSADDFILDAFSFTNDSHETQTFRLAPLKASSMKTTPNYASPFRKTLFHASTFTTGLLHFIQQHSRKLSYLHLHLTICFTLHNILGKVHVTKQHSRIFLFMPQHHSYFIL